MDYILWIIPFVLAIATSIFFNLRTNFKVIKRNFILFTILDVIKTYSFMVFIISFLLDKPFIILLSFIVALLSVLSHLLFKDKHIDDNLLLTFETYKNNIVVQFSLFIPYLCFLFIFRQIDSLLLLHLFSLLAAVLVFYISFYLKPLAKRLYKLLSEPLSRGSIPITYGIYAVVVLFFVFFVILTIPSDTALYPTVDDLYIDTSINTNHTFDWDEVSYIDMDVHQKNDGVIYDRYLVVNDVEKTFFVYTTNHYENLTSNFNATEISLDSIDSSNNQILNYPYLATSTGVYESDAQGNLSVIASTQNMPSYWITYENDLHFIVKSDENQYQLYTEQFLLVQTIANKTIKVISNQLFIEENQTYIHYETNKSYTTIENSTPYYDANHQALFQVNHAEGIVYVDTSSQADQYRVDLEDHDMFAPIYDGQYYDYRRFPYQIYQGSLADGLEVYTFIQLDEPLAFMVYDSSKYKYATSSLEDFRVIEKDAADNYAADYFQFNDDESVYHHNMIKYMLRFAIPALLFMFIPYDLAYTKPSVESFDDKLNINT